MQTIIYFKKYRFDALWSFLAGAILFAISYRFQIGFFYFDYWLLVFSAIYILWSYKKYLAIGEGGLIYFSGIFNQKKVAIQWPNILSADLKKFKRKYSITVGARDYIPVVVDEEVPCLQIKLKPNIFESIKKTVPISKKYIRLNEENSSLDLWDSEHFDLEKIVHQIEKYKPIKKNNIQLESVSINWFGKIILFVFKIFIIVASVLWVTWLIKSRFL